MSSAAPDERDAYDDLLRDTRGLRREQAVAREAWFATLPVDRKVEQLFELEILLKGFACFANPRNHPGPSRKTPVVAQDFREHATLVREGLARAAHISRALLAERERAFVFQRYLETVLPDDGVRTKLVGEAGAHENPERSLFVLRHGILNVLEVTTWLTRLPRVPFRLFYALLATMQREIAQSAYFNPLHALEFRPEFDRITNPQMLDLVRAVEGEWPRRLVALTVLSLFRMLRYLNLAERVSEEATEAPKRSIATVYLVLSVLRSDARALAGYLRRRTGPLLAEGFEAEIFALDARDMRAQTSRLEARAATLLVVKDCLEGLAANLRLELRRAFERDFPPLDASPTLDDLGAAVRRAITNLRPALRGAVVMLGRSLGARLDPSAIFGDPEAVRALDERRRRDLWMFAQIVRAFATKVRAIAVDAGDGWAGGSPLAFVREFLGYFQALGHGLLRASGYPHLEPFVRAITRLRDAAVADAGHVAPVVTETERLYRFLVDAFGALGRDELADVPFDRRAAAQALKLYLGE